MYFKPYKDIETAIHNWRNDYNLRTGKVKIKSHNNIYKDECSLIDATILCSLIDNYQRIRDAIQQSKLNYKKHNMCSIWGRAVIHSFTKNI